MMKRPMMVLLVGLVGTACICHAEDKPEPARVMANDQGVWFRADTVVREADLGKTVKAQPGSLVDVELAENGTTGYMWKCTWEPTAAVTLVRSATIGPATEMPGAGWTRHFLLLVNQATKATVTVQYGRWWDKGERNEPKSFTIDASVAPDVTIRAADFHGEANLKVGQTAEIILATNPTTGFSWKFAYAPAGTILEVVSDAYVQCKPVVPGKGGERHILLRAKQAGQCVITAQYQRSWEGGEKQTPKTLTVKVAQ